MFFSQFTARSSGQQVIDWEFSVSNGERGVIGIVAERMLIVYLHLEIRFKSRSGTYK